MHHCKKKASVWVLKKDLTISDWTSVIQSAVFKLTHTDVTEEQFWRVISRGERGRGEIGWQKVQKHQKRTDDVLCSVSWAAEINSLRWNVSIWNYFTISPSCVVGPSIVYPASFYCAAFHDLPAEVKCYVNNEDERRCAIQVPVNRSHMGNV